MQYLNVKLVRNHDTRRIILVAAFLMTFLLAACSSTPTPAPTTDPSIIQTQSAQTVVAQETAVAPPVVTPTLPPPPGPTPNSNVVVAVVPEPQPGQPSATANYNTLIYGGPGTNYVTYGVLLGSKQTVVVGKSEDGLWWAIDVPVAANKVGWVSAGWVTVQGAEGVPVLSTPPVPPNTALVPPGPNDPQATSLVNTYIRTGPGDNYPAYGIAEAGRTAFVLGKSPDGQWLVVRLNPEVVGAGFGWAALQNVQMVNTENVPIIEAGAPPAAVPPPAPAPGVPSATAIDYVNVRTGPGMNYGVVLVAPPGASGEVTGKSADGEWWQVKISTRYAASGLGWASRYYVTTSNTDGVPVVDAPLAPSFPVAPPNSSTCTLVGQNPADDTVFAPNTSFQASWTLQNAGPAVWDSTNFTVRFLGSNGVPLHLGSDLYNLANNVDMGQTYTVNVPMIAPAGPGKYGELWGIFSGDNASVCQFWLTIEVK